MQTFLHLRLSFIANTITDLSIGRLGRDITRREKEKGIGYGGNQNDQIDDKGNHFWRE